MENGELRAGHPHPIKKTMKKNVIEEKSYAFAIRTVNLYKYLRFEENEFVLSKQILRCGTSIGANVCEAEEAQSRKDFVSKMNIALKETSETKYWLRLLKDTGFIDEASFNSMFDDCCEIHKIISSIIISSNTNEN